MRRQADALGFGADPYAFGFEDLPDPLRHVFILTRDQARRFLDDGHVGAEAPVDLRELQTDVAAAHHDEMPGHLIERQHRGVREEGHVMNAGHIGNQRPSADIDEDPGGGQLLFPDADRVRALESGVSLDDRAAIHLSQRFLDALARVGGNGVGPRLDPGHVDPHVAIQHDAVVGGPTREMCGIRAGHQRLGGHASGVDAGAAEELALHERDCHSGASQAAGERRSGLSGPDDDGVEASHGSADNIRKALPEGLSESRRARSPGRTSAGSTPRPALPDCGTTSTATWTRRSNAPCAAAG